MGKLDVLTRTVLPRLGGSVITCAPITAVVLGSIPTRAASEMSFIFHSQCLLVSLSFSTLRFSTPSHKAALTWPDTALGDVKHGFANSIYLFCHGD